MKFKFWIAFYVAKMGQAFLRLLKRNATYFPGKVAIKICPQFLKYIDRPTKIIAVTGTNGKTTVCNMINDILIDNGYNVLNNRLGSNINSGIASSLIEHTSIFNKTKKDLAVFEVDERSSILIYQYIKPDYLVCTNLFRDSIKRNAHTDYIVDIINSKLPRETVVLANADDLIACSIGKENNHIYFGIDKLDTDVEETTNIIKDIKTCPKCDTKLKYEYARYHHLGKAYCPNCDFKSPESNFLIRNIDKERKEIIIKEDVKSYKYNMLSDSIFNIYNELAAISILRIMGLSATEINNSIKKIKIVETRLSEEIINEKRVITHLSKGQNPVAASRVFDYVKSVEGNKAVILIIDDCDDAKHSSENLTWLYDADFELLNDDNIKQVIIGGVRANDYYLRLLLAGVPEEKVSKIEDELKTVSLINQENVDTIFILHDIYKFDVASNLKELLRNN
jgi:UDP-N-acetylmuramyl tripeptide synthase